MTEKTHEFAELVSFAAERGILKKLVVSKLSDKQINKAVVEPRSHSGKLIYVLESYLADGKKTQKNHNALPIGEIDQLLCSCMQANLIYAGGECEFKASKKGNAAILGAGKLKNAASDTAVIKPLNKEKNYILSGSEPFLRELDITDQNGRIRDKRQAKFRQICRFLEYVRDMLPHLPKDKIVIYDLCCGKSYLSFAVYHYFKSILGREVYMLCVDLKAEVMEFCADTARKLGYDGMEFRCADITKLESDAPPDLVLSLHACDTATDLVLENAVRLGAEVILSTPCCHRDLSRRIDCTPLAFATRYSILKSKLCDALTDSMRLCYLEKEGYRVDACELVDPEDTPKNVILRASKIKGYSKESAKAKEKAREYDEIRSFLGL